MAAASETYSSSASDGGLIALLGQERYEDYFSAGEDGGVVVGGASDTDESQACALESIVDITVSWKPAKPSKSRQNVVIKSDTVIMILPPF